MYIEFLPDIKLALNLIIYLESEVRYSQIFAVDCILKVSCPETTQLSSLLHF